MPHVMHLLFVLVLFWSLRAPPPSSSSSSSKRDVFGGPWCLAETSVMPSGGWTMNLTEAGDAFMTPTRPVHTDDFFFVVSPAVVHAYTATSRLLWIFAMEVDFCCPNSTDSADVSSTGFGGSSSSSGILNCGPPVLFVLTNATIFLNCGPSSVTLSTATGAILSSYRIPNNNVAQQIQRVGADMVAIRTHPDPNVTVFNPATWTPYWTRHYDNATVPPVINCDGAENGTVAVIQFQSDYSAVVEGRDARTGHKKWGAIMDMFASPSITSLPQYSRSVIAWFGPAFALVRLLFLPTGRYWQYVPGFVVSFMLPTDSGIVAISSKQVITALDASNEAVLWSVTVPFTIADFDISDDGEYVMAWASDPTQPNVVLSLRYGTSLFSCGPYQCARPCVTGVTGYNATLVARCAPNQGNAVAELTMHDSWTGAVVSDSVLIALRSPLPLEVAPAAPRLACAYDDSNVTSMTFLIVTPRNTSLAPHAMTQPTTWVGNHVAVVVAACLVLFAVIALLVFFVAARLRAQQPPAPTSLLGDSDDDVPDHALRTSMAT